MRSDVGECLPPILYVRFEDGVAGEVDVAALVVFDRVFAPLMGERQFAEVEVNRELGTICSPGGADLDPDVLYARGEPILDLAAIDVPSARRA